jgi:hypothetical protein
MGWWKNLLLIIHSLKFSKRIILFENFTKIQTIFKIEACSSVDRASDSDSESQGFDSLHAYEVIFEKD